MEDSKYYGNNFIGLMVPLFNEKALKEGQWMVEVLQSNAEVPSPGDTVTARYWTNGTRSEIEKKMDHLIELLMKEVVA